MISLFIVQSYLTLCDPWTKGSSVHGILQTRILEWVAMPFSRGSSWPRDQTHVSWVSCIIGRFFTIWVTRDDSTNHICLQIFPNLICKCELYSPFPMWHETEMLGAFCSSWLPFTTQAEMELCVRCWTYIISLPSHYNFTVLSLWVPFDGWGNWGLEKSRVVSTAMELIKWNAVWVHICLGQRLCFWISINRRPLSIDLAMHSLGHQSPEEPGQRTQCADSELRILFLKGYKSTFIHNSLMYLEGFHHGGRKQDSC